MEVSLDYRNCESILIAFYNEHYYSSGDFGKTWKAASESRLYPYGFTDRGCHPINRNVRYRIVNESCPSSLVGCVFLERSADGGKTWERKNAVKAHLKISLVPQRIFYDYRNENTIYMESVQISNEPTYYVSHDGGNIFEPILKINGGLFAVSQSNPNILYAADNEANIYKSVDSGKEWKAILSCNQVRQTVIERAKNKKIIHDASEVRGFKATSLTIDPKASERVYVVTEFGIIRTDDGGKTWCGVRAPGLAGSVYQLLIDPNDSEVICLGTECGLYRSTNGGRDWKMIDL